jgi:DNA invertase Pin-like site-specific DNA recombinase
LKLAIAKDERQKISERTIAALGVLKAKGVTLGKIDNFSTEGRMKGVEAIKTKAKNNVNNRKAKAFINALVTQGLNHSKIAEQLNDNGFVTSRGKQFQAVQVQRLIG